MSGISQMKCLDCPLKDIGETGSFSTSDIKNTHKSSEIIIAIPVTQIIY
jgi:hypothetical protein